MTQNSVTMINTGQFKKRKRTQRDYSLSFKLQIIDEIEKGHLTWIESQRKYGIQGKSTVLVWLRKHGTLNWQSEMKVKKKPSPNRQIAELEAKIKRLEAEKEILNRAIDIADDMLSTDIRKKYLPLSQQASESQQGEENTPSE